MHMNAIANCYTYFDYISCAFLYLLCINVCDKLINVHMQYVYIYYVYGYTYNKYIRKCAQTRIICIVSTRIFINYIHNKFHIFKIIIYTTVFKP